MWLGNVRAVVGERNHENGCWSKPHECAWRSRMIARRETLKMLERLFDAEFEGGFCGAFADEDFIVAAMGEHRGE
jgi:hypothetical protein